MTNLNFTDQEKDLLNSAGISMLVLFGSQAQNISSPASDYDILVFGPDTKKSYDLVYDLLSGKIQKLVDIDIVFASVAPGELLNHASTYGQVLYAKSPVDFANFRQKVMLDYSDFAPYRYLFQQATLARI